jgi:hypothetical protein
MIIFSVGDIKRCQKIEIPFLYLLYEHLSSNIIKTVIKTRYTMNNSIMLELSNLWVGILSETNWRDLRRKIHKCHDPEKTFLSFASRRSFNDQLSERIYRPVSVYEHCLHVMQDYVEIKYSRIWENKHTKSTQDQYRIYKVISPTPFAYQYRIMAKMEQWRNDVLSNREKEVLLQIFLQKCLPTDLYAFIVMFL